MRESKAATRADALDDTASSVDYCAKQLFTLASAQRELTQDEQKAASEALGQLRAEVKYLREVARSMRDDLASKRLARSVKRARSREQM